MNPASHHRFVLCGAVAVFVATAFAGWQLAGGGQETSPTPDAPAAANARSAKLTERVARTARRYGTPAQVNSRMAGIEAATTPEERMRATIALVESLSAEELVQWLDQRWFEKRGFELTLFNKLAKDRLAELDPEAFMVWARLEESGTFRSMLNAWTASEPHRVIDYFKANPDEQQEIQALGEIAKTQPDLALARFSEMAGGLNPHSISGHYAQELLRALARSAPGSLEASLDSLPESMRQGAESALVGERLKGNFTGELSKLWERADGWTLFQSAFNQLPADERPADVLDHIADFPPAWRQSIAENMHSFISGDNGSRWLGADLEAMGFTAEQVKRIQPSILSATASQNPEEALEMMYRWELDNRSRNHVLRTAIVRHASDPGRSAELISLLHTDAERKVASGILASFASSPEPQVDPGTPSEWLDVFAGSDTNPQNPYRALSSLRGWDQQQIAELGAEFRQLPDERKSTVAEILAGTTHGGSEIPRDLRGEAIGYLVGAAEDGAEAHRQLLQLTSFHAAKWAEEDPLGAARWTESLPASEAKNWARKNLAITWAQYDPAAADRWVGRLPAETRAEVREFMKSPGSGN